MIRIERSFPFSSSREPVSSPRDVSFCSHPIFDWNSRHRLKVLPGDLSPRTLHPRLLSPASPSPVPHVCGLASAAASFRHAGWHWVLTTGVHGIDDHHCRRAPTLAVVARLHRPRSESILSFFESLIFFPGV
jgi:hypothetical protein